MQLCFYYNLFKLVCTVVYMFLFWMCDFGCLGLSPPLGRLPSNPPPPLSVWTGTMTLPCRPLQQSPAAGYLLRAGERVLARARRTPHAPPACRSPYPESSAHRAFSGQAQRGSLLLGVPPHRGSRLPGPPRASGRSVRAQ